MKSNDPDHMITLFKKKHTVGGRVMKQLNLEFMLFSTKLNIHTDDNSVFLMMDCWKCSVHSRLITMLVLSRDLPCTVPKFGAYYTMTWSLIFTRLMYLPE